MSIRYLDSCDFKQSDGVTPCVALKCQITLSTRMGSRFMSKREYFTVYGSDTATAISKAKETAEKIAELSDGKLTNMKFNISIYIKDTGLIGVPPISEKAMVVLIGQGKAVSFINIPWVKSGITIQNLVTAFDANDYLGSVKLSDDGTDAVFSATPIVKHVDKKLTKFDDNIVTSPDTKGDDGVDGYGSGLN